MNIRHWIFSYPTLDRGSGLRCSEGPAASARHLAVEEGGESLPIGVGDTDNLFADVDAVVAVDGPDLVERDDIG